MIPARGPQTKLVYHLSVAARLRAGTGGSREPPVPVKGVQEISGLAARKHYVEQAAARRHHVGPVPVEGGPSCSDKSMQV